jgi:hypothetical protein
MTSSAGMGQLTKTVVLPATINNPIIGISMYYFLLIIIYTFLTGHVKPIYSPLK